MKVTLKLKATLVKDELPASYRRLYFKTKDHKLQYGWYRSRDEFIHFTLADFKIEITKVLVEDVKWWTYIDDVANIKCNQL